MKDCRINFLSELSSSNVGVKNSFLSLLYNVESDYYFFCDQDDFWLPNKVKDTLELLKKKEKDYTPICVHTDLKIVDQELTIINNSMIQSQGLYKEDTLERLLVQNSVTGCTMAINDSLKKLALKKCDVEKIIMHDWWLAIIAASYGSVELLDESTILYRQHGNNEVGAQSILSKIKSGYNLDKMILSIVGTFVQANELIKVYQETLPEDSKKTIKFYLSILSNQSKPFLYKTWFKKFHKKSKIKNGVFYLINSLYSKKIKELTKRKISM